MGRWVSYGILYTRQTANAYDRLCRLKKKKKFAGVHTVPPERGRETDLGAYEGHVLEQWRSCGFAGVGQLRSSRYNTRFIP